MQEKKLVSPILKWAGGKRQLLPDIRRYIPKTIATYYEPFLGGGAVLFDIQPQQAKVNDINSELINLYRVVQENVECLIADLAKHRNEAEYYYATRAWDRDPEFYQKLSSIEKASRIHFLNKTCFNGLFRVNRSGQFNAPFGKYKNPNIVNAKVLRAVSQYFNQADIEFTNRHFTEVLSQVTPEDFVYFDPPYDPLSSSASFTSYAQGGFSQKDQIQLKALCDELTRRGIRFLLSNSATDFILDLYQDYTIEQIPVKRLINSKGSARGAVNEVLVSNYTL